jgi:3,4-dihydroxy 2-butanone 4-phosphate synthase/GTP cyclohydrolase II
LLANILSEIFIMKFSTIEQAVKDIKAGKLIILVDDKERENEGDLVCAAQKVTPKIINFMITHGRGLVCMPLDGKRLDQLEITPMVNRITDPMHTAFTVSVDAAPKFGVTTGISARDRAKTIKVILDPKTTPPDLVRPGHIFPLRVYEGGVLRRAGHTEAAVDLACLAGLEPAGVICEIIKENGEMARLPFLLKFSNKHNLSIITIADLIKYRRGSEKLVKRTVAAKLPSKFGDFTVIGYENILDGEEHIAIVKGKINGGKKILVRVHSQCLTGDVFGSKRCDCGEQLARSLALIEKEGRGVVLYMRQEGRGIGLLNKLKAYRLQDSGYDTVEANQELGFEADLRDYGIGAQILADLGLHTIRLITNNPRKIVGIEGYGLKVVKRVPLVVKPNKHNAQYLRVKSRKLGHWLGRK